MTTDTATAAPRFYEQTWDLSYRHALGSTVGAFLDGLREHKILGTVCDSCSRVLVPPRSYCDRCSVPTAGWRQVANEGVIEMMTIVYEAFKGLPEPPYAIAYVRLDDASTALLGYVRGTELSVPAEAARRLAIGTRVTVRYAEEPRGDVTDYWFEVAQTSGASP